MAIKKSKPEKQEAALPQPLDQILEKGFTASVLEKHFGSEAKDARAEAYDFIDQKKGGFDVADYITGSSFGTRFGTVTIVDKPSYSIDRDQLIDLVQSGRITVETLLNIANFPAEKLRTAVGEKVFGDVATKEEKQYLQLKASADFKAEVSAAFDEPASKPVAVKKKANTKKSSSLDKVRAAKKKGKAAGDDLEDILNG